ncbi:uncharacterized protein LOC111350739 [Spodoptera litura]|uniref:Uncharacterized protein LOC111350739 n=1 Tax=Spodoptera litura TaxID=69820 RepID=A0A9J7IP48_SPOLT|nr:uncharacterized protein LOC111350739 [Spodoptera litura]
MFEKPVFPIPTKPIPHSPKISPSSIPNPNPSVMTPKQVDGYPNFGSYLYSIPGYSAFQPINSVQYPPIIPPTMPPPIQPEVPTSEYMPFPTMSKEPHTPMVDVETTMDMEPPKDLPKQQTDFEEHFTPEIITATSMPEVANPQTTESKMSITSLAQGSGATVTIPSQLPNKEFNKKKPERFSLKTSIPISKIDMKCVSNPPDTAFQNSLAKKPFSSSFTKDSPRVEIQSNIVIKSATIEPEVKELKPSVPPTSNICTLINPSEPVNKTDNQFRVPEPKIDTPSEVKDTPSMQRPLFNPINIETSKVNFSKPPEQSYNEQKNQIVFIQNKNNTNPKMLLTIQQQNPQVLLQRANFDSKNLQAPSRLSSQSKKCKEDVVNESTSSKVVALKRLHQENCDENDFENLITENQIYGNKIVVKEKSQGTSQEQDLKTKKVTEKVTTTVTETKNVVLQPNFVYLSNVQFPNLMMIKNNSKVTQTPDSNKPKLAPKEIKIAPEISTPTTVGTTVTTVAVPVAIAPAAMTPATMCTETITEVKSSKPSTIVTQEVQVLKTSSNVLQTLPNITKPDIVIQANPTVIVSPQIVYQVPITTIVEAEKVNQPFKKRDYPKFIAPKKEAPKKSEQRKTNDKLFIACPYQMDSKLQPKIVITNIRPKINKVEEVSSLDDYEKRKRLRRLKYLSNRDNKEVKADAKPEPAKKVVEKTEIRNNIITPDKVKSEIYKEFAKRKAADDGSSESDSDDYGEDDLKVYEEIIDEFGVKDDKEKRKVEFMSHLRLATLQDFKERELELQDKVLRNDSVAAAYAAVGRLDVLRNVPVEEEPKDEEMKEDNAVAELQPENRATMQRKKLFLSKLKLTQVTQKYKEGYDKVWQEILKERKRRYSNPDLDDNCKEPRLGFDPNCQLRLLTEIKKFVNENNNLIKKRLDSTSNGDSNEESIKVLAEKNFSELNRLSKMADTSVKLFKTPNTRKRDLNPGFDSENIKNPNIKVQQPYENYPKIKIPSVAKIISLKTTQECPTTTSTQATSMDEPQNSAAGVTQVEEDTSPPGLTRDVGCQVDEPTWAGLEALAKSYREYDAVRRKEIIDLHKRNTTLKIEGAHITRSASRDSDTARALLAERQNLSVEENKLRVSLKKIQQAIDIIRNY